MPQPKPQWGFYWFGVLIILFGTLWAIVAKVPFWPAGGICIVWMIGGAFMQRGWSLL